MSNPLAVSGLLDGYLADWLASWLAHLLTPQSPLFFFLHINPAACDLSPLSFISCFGVIRGPFSRGKRVPKLVPFLVPFLSRSGPQNGPQNGPLGGLKIGENLDHCWTICFGDFGALQVPLGRLLGPSGAVLDGLRPQKH